MSGEFAPRFGRLTDLERQAALTVGRLMLLEFNQYFWEL